VTAKPEFFYSLVRFIMKSKSIVIIICIILIPVILDYGINKIPVQFTITYSIVELYDQEYDGANNLHRIIPRGLVFKYLRWRGFDYPDLNLPEGDPIVNYIMSHLGSGMKIDEDRVWILLQMAFDDGALPNEICSRTGLTPLHFAVLVKSVRSIEIILKNGGDLNARNSHSKPRYDNLTPLQFAEGLSLSKKQDYSSVVNYLKQAEKSQI